MRSCCGCGCLLLGALSVLALPVLLLVALLAPDDLDEDTERTAIATIFMNPFAD